MPSCCSTCRTGCADRCTAASALSFGQSLAAVDALFDAYDSSANTHVSSTRALSAPGDDLNVRVSKAPAERRYVYPSIGAFIRTLAPLSKHWYMARSRGNARQPRAYVWQISKIMPSLLGNMAIGVQRDIRDGVLLAHEIRRAPQLLLHDL